ncbi:MULTISPECIES: TetR/AcrR family transcriptional regulator [Pantoea]|uniref:TetR/AcrR family transcriptional regulator n=1 Tax=Candidatus Pantoea multigeneris TaxID=2608357 RepID=A0ABX0RLW7_9GAMM|nr:MULTISPECIES: TetR/AcrR family transcriptional regulator [Pantoea]NIF24355.1 TetR/AcrR family transcriptional regulator [Pantoea multigeneris]
MQSKKSSLTKGEKTRERLLEVAADLFAEKQFHGTRISDIVQAAGVTQPSFYSYFPSKEAIYQQLIARFDEELEELVVSLLIDAALPRENVLSNLTESFHRYLTFFTSNRNLTRISLFQQPQDAETRRKLQRWIARNMRIEQERGFFSAEVPVEVLAGCYLGVLLQTLLQEPQSESLAAISLERGKFLYGGLTFKP